MSTDIFPALLAGPMIRRVEPSKAIIWVATSREFEIAADVYEIIQKGEIDCYSKKCSITETETIQFGINLYIHLIKITPTSNSFPTNQLIGYNLYFQNQQESFDLEDLGLLAHSNPSKIVYDTLKLPTFFIPDEASEFTANFLFGSCRKQHGEGKDMLALGDRVIEEYNRDLNNRPGALFLMGDQIYADNVADPLFRPINKLGRRLMGVQESLPSIDKRLANNPFSTSLNRINGRKEIMKDFAKFSSRNASNHLIEFGEFTAMYLFSWSPVLWEVSQEENLFESFEEAYKRERFYLKLSRGTDKLKQLEKAQLQMRYIEQEKLIADCHSATYKIRRLFANTPTYMIFDDHDMTDDWNINAYWKTKVQESPLGKHIIANGLSAYFAFQGWGNEPENFSSEFTCKITKYFRGLHSGQMMANYEEWINLLWNHQPWHFVTPTIPKAVFLDTRTLRAYEDQPKITSFEQPFEDSSPPPQLINEQEYKELTKQLKESGWKRGDFLIIVSPTPVIGFDLIEKWIVQFLPILEKLGAHVQTIFDVEAWRYNGKGLTNFLKQLTEWCPKNPVILSGDVHYSFSVSSRFTFTDRNEMDIKQITSSPIKNMSFKNLGMLMKVTAALSQALQQTGTIYRYCDSSYLIHDADKDSFSEKDFIWEEQLLYEQIAGTSIIETDNTLGYLSYSTNRVENKFLK
ncbi:alkaline phosphatase D family protein [Ureibacillus aquaedulcis]|uniref:Alkaline phosphatase D family protein n=1 Tax=Ureibacillus aquaedulcis TaxID=3058421 RepID=A0ABT8GRI2_9BACL|nr:alkaline phosphatase D family protein [Ureibacillus sp. BA0131]MDN4493556.1 alkaline phosphatase D family protein [Ureibacillus sp. BA0131]